MAPLNLNPFLPPSPPPPPSLPFLLRSLPFPCCFLSVLGMTIDDVLWITPSQTLKGKAVVQKLLDKAPRPGFCQEMSKSVTLNNSKLASYRRAGSVTPRPGSDAFAVAQTVEILDGKVVKFEEERTSGF